MELNIISDLHLDIWEKEGYGEYILSFFEEEDEERKDNRILIMSGDIGESRFFKTELFQRFFRIISKNFYKVIMIAGNHEYYFQIFEETPNIIKDALKEFENILFLEKDVCIIDGKRFLGTTLWSDTKTDKLTEKNIIERGLTDYKVIKTISSKNNYNGFIDSNFIYEEFKKSLDWLKGEIKEGDIVITHHLPSINSIDFSYLVDPLSRIFNKNFYSNLNQEISDLKPSLWIHGHTHHNLYYKYDYTTIICNPLGYPSEKNVVGSSPLKIVKN